MKILVGVIVALVVLLGLTAWGLKSSVEASTELRDKVNTAVGKLEDAGKQNQTLNDRFDTLDAALGGLAKTQQQNAIQLAKTQKAIKGITKQAGDSDASMTCLDLPVPAQLGEALK